MSWADVPLTLTTDRTHGGRWTSLAGADREWLWTHPDPAQGIRRARVFPGAAFVDAGGTEEALPTVRGTPDHGDVWCRPWWGDDGLGTSGVGCRLAGPAGWVAGELRRTVRRVDDGLRVDYQVHGPPGARFVHAVHALLEVGPTARLRVEAAGPAWELADDGGAAGAVRWPSGLDLLGPDDGTAVCVLVPGVRRVHVADGDDRLSLTWTADDDDRCSLLLWRNLRGGRSAGRTGRSGSNPWWGAPRRSERRGRRTWCGCR